MSADRCPAVWRYEPDVRCMKQAGHEGKHRGARMVPEAVWFGDEDVRPVGEGPSSLASGTPNDGPSHPKDPA